MSPIDQLIAKLDPSQFTLTMLIYGVFITFVLFLWFKWWPWYTKEYWPARVERDKQREINRVEAERESRALITSVRDMAAEIKTLTQQWVLLHRTHDEDTRRNQQAIMEQIVRIESTRYASANGKNAEEYKVPAGAS